MPVPALHLPNNLLFRHFGGMICEMIVWSDETMRIESVGGTLL